MWVFSHNYALTGVAVYSLVPLAIYFLSPKLLAKVSKKKIILKQLLLVAVLLFFIAEFLPSPLIHSQNTQFMTHFVGGGLFTGFLWLFTIKNLNLKLNPVAELASLYFLVSGLGVANELFEFFANGIGLYVISSSDTWWDLFANVLGAFVFWLGYKILSK